MLKSDDPLIFLRSLYDAAVAAAQPDKVIPHFMPQPPENGRVFVIGAGKASAQMAQAFERNWHHHETHPLSGVVITRYGYGAACEYIEVLEASHPVPDQAGLNATAQLIRFLKDAQLTANDLVVCLISGGGSALLVQPVLCLSLAEKAAINNALLKSGAKIQDMNIIRKQISQIKGGGLGALCQPAYLHSLIISDVAGDDLYSIASAPTLPAQHNNADALALIERYSIPIPDALRDYLNQDDAAPKVLAIRQDIHVIASAKLSLQAAASCAEAQGLTVKIISDALEGDSGAVARLHIEQVMQLKSAPYLLLSGGETTVQVRGTGRGGNNGQFALEALKAANGAENIYGLAADTDGIDGSEDNAGAFFSPELFKAAQAQGLDVGSYIANNDSYGFFEAIDGLLVTGPTQTNVNDFRALYITS
jgi:hydroxypyruvate reductase